MYDLQSLAIEWLEENWELESNLGERPDNWLVHDLVELVRDSHVEPVSTHAPVIRRLVLEHHFLDCDNCVEVVVTPAQINKQVDVLVGVLERLRKLAVESGTWSDVPVTPQMFG